MAVCTRVRSPDDEHRPFVVAAYRLTGYRVDKCQPPGSDKANLAGGLDSLFKPAYGSVCWYQHDRADLIGALGCGLLHEWRDVAVWRVQPYVAGNAQVISPWRLQCVLLGGDELPSQRVMRRLGGIQLKAKLSIK